MTEYTFRLPIGDWSGDGHSVVEYFKIKSNKPVVEVRELYFETIAKLGVGLDSQVPGSPCSDYEDSFLTKKWLIAAQITDKDLAMYGGPSLSHPDGFGWEERDSLNLEEKEYVTYISADIMAELFVVFMRKHNPDLEMEIVFDPDDTFSFYGTDSKGRHIGFIGYGCVGQ